jgi:hypothetical protein
MVVLSCDECREQLLRVATWHFSKSCQHEPKKMRTLRGRRVLILRRIGIRNSHTVFIIRAAIIYYGGSILRTRVAHSGWPKNIETEVHNEGPYVGFART